MVLKNLYPAWLCQNSYCFNGPVEIWSFPIEIAWWIFPVRYVTVYQAGSRPGQFQHGFHHGRLSKLHPLVADRQLRYLWPGCNCGGCVGECAMDLLKIGRKSEETCFLEEKICRKPWFYWLLTVFQPCFWTEHVLQTMDFSCFYSQTIQISSGFPWFSDFPFNTGILFLWWSIGLL